MVIAALFLSSCTSTAKPPASTPSPSASASRPTSPITDLQVAGSMSARSDHAAGESSCSYGEFVAGRVRFVTSAMPMGSGGVLRAGMEVLPLSGSQPAESPVLAGNITPVRVEQYPTGASGALIGAWLATSGTITVSSVRDVDRKGYYGVISGTVDAQLSQSGGGKPLHLTGTWGCVVDPPAG
jgi:hypothetical protein